MPDGEGGYRTMLTQNGTVSSVDGARLTVKSADGWAHDYILDTSTVVGGNRLWSPGSGADLTEGQEVTVVATVTDGNAHADRVQTLPDTTMRMPERGDRVLKLRSGPRGDVTMPAPHGIDGPPAGDGDRRVRRAPAPPDADVEATPGVQPGTLLFDGSGESFEIPLRP